MRYAPMPDPRVAAPAPLVASATAPSTAAALARPCLPGWIGRAAALAGQGAYALALLLFLALPLGAILLNAAAGQDGAGGLALVRDIVLQPAFLGMVARSLAVGLTTAALVVPCAYAYAYALTRTAVPGKGALRVLALLPLLAPSLLPGIALVYLFGNQGLLKELTGGATIYGFWGIVAGEAFY
ncbi:MAG: putative 2-aminoethylphosphonate ABC transporter permease subunit, partial [Bordetella sp.]|nr:putative 2-aminoethylphosphonate ABC transporter permease subunit [Bordetella sp.]